MARLGYPIAECNPDGSFVITKHAGTGGLVDVRTVTSQLLYEMGDPQTLHRPRRRGRLHLDPARAGWQGSREGHRRARRPRDPTYKVSIAYRKGWKAQGQLTVAGPDAVEKAQLCAKVVFERLAMDGVTFANDEKLVELVGAGVCHAGIVAAGDPNEVVLRIGVKSDDEKKVARFGYELAPLVTGARRGHRFRRRAPRRDRDHRLLARAHLEDQSHDQRERRGGVGVKVQLSQIAYARSGDKGDGSNVGIAAYTPEGYECLRRELTAERVKQHFRGIALGAVDRYEAPICWH